LAWATFKFILCDREEKSETPVKRASGHEESESPVKKFGHEEGVEVTKKPPAHQDTFLEEEM